ncbi:PREDICTED: pentatricopeptide repeat-containing protein At1g73400, mitochondrial [Tarenaya hassleriana]|uniref:pentatricopeptide repeat-containing protein At1g73400, mitochondrial n=1 Tax=Tarenaya hassleriana TaxID=28532 RepID=UPI00053C7A01|nr:PREDICTED: pentatricopeptide repeat-containing protein At1g73400, mitochondrial [Tarenaya hassleriana]
MRRLVSCFVRSSISLNFSTTSPERSEFVVRLLNSHLIAYGTGEICYPDTFRRYLFCSPTFSIDGAIDSCVNNVGDRCLEDVAANSKEFGLTTRVTEGRTLGGLEETEISRNGCDHMVEIVCETIMANLNAYDDMEKALDDIRVELTTPLVLQILQRFHYEEKVAFRFFTWAGHQENYSHEPCAYNEMIDILSSTKYKNKQFRIVIEMLDYMKRNKKTAVPADVLQEILRKYCEKYLTHVQKFSAKKRIRVKTQPEINSFNVLLDALCKSGLVKDAEALFKRMKRQIKPDANTYNVLFFGWCRVRDPKKGMALLEEMIQAGCKPDNFTYNAAIDAFCKVGKVNEAVELFDFMITKGSTVSAPTAKTFAVMIAALARYDRMEECFELIGRMISIGCLPDVSTYKEVIEGICMSGKTEEAYKFLHEMRNKGYPPDIVTYNCFLRVLCENKKSDDALKLYGTMIEVGCIPSVQTYNMLISMFFEMDDPDRAFDTWHEMDKRNCRQDTETFCVMINGLFGCNRADEACFLLEEVVNRRLNLPYRMFDSFLTRLSAAGNLRAIHRLSEHMRNFYNPGMARRFALNEKRQSVKLRGK